MIETAIISILTENAGVAAQVEDRVRPFTDANTTAYPCLTYWRSTTERPISNDGATGQAIATFQLDAWARDAATCWAVLDAVRLAFNAIKPRTTIGGIRIDMIRLQDQQDMINVPALPGKQKPIQRQTAVYVISYAEALAAAGGASWWTTPG